VESGRVGEKKENMINNWISQPDFGVIDGDFNASWEGGQSAWRRLAFQSPVLLLPVISLSFLEKEQMRL
jgi:hypothetical protein